MRRGFVFTLDAMLSLVLVTLFITSIVAITSSTSQVYSTYMRSQSEYIATDTLETLRTVSLNQLVPPEKVDEWLNDGTLDEELVSPEMTPLDIVATYWATEPLYPSKNLSHKAEVILGYILNQRLKGYNYELLINNYTSPYLRKVGSNYSEAPDVSPATLVMSGYAYNQTPRGYMARAYLTKATTTQEKLYGWMWVLASGALSNTLTITRIINFPWDAQILEADGKFVARQGEMVTLYINGANVSSWPGQINLNNLANYLGPGPNNITLVYSNAQGDEIGSGSGTTMYVKYKTDSPLVEDPGLFEVYDVTSERTGFMYLFELFVPGNISSINMKFKIRNVSTVRLYYGLGGNLTLLLTKSANSSGDAVVSFTDQEIKGALSNLGVSYSNLSKMVFDFVVGFDAYYENEKWYYEGGDYYNDGADRERRLYGYPDSYVRITYTTPVSVTLYSIPLSVYFPYGDNRVTYDGNGLQVRYSLPPRVQPWYADWWVGYIFEGSTTQVLSENGREFYRGPLGRYAIRVAYTRLYDWMMVPGQENSFEISMENGNSYIRDYETRGIIYYFLKAYAGYGDVFKKFMRPGCKGYNITYYWQDSSVATPQQAYILAGDAPYCDVTTEQLLANRSTYAVDDAIIRLFNNLGGDGTRSSPILVKLPNEGNIDFASMGNIPGLFQPIQITLRVWREG
ncbi:hypothetical protein [Thermococcus gorgonarius]|uniref:Uncharacterized protein n=1 Tax=Thermococcus gorgonarius TaxID=71997 RepID=A0A2Z2M5F0_THEGO|nr:hypothetical protein [Thermococcus gorgonarius]ASJ01187.1 hypothetical protein A3K92_06670 [Thermococcus gorgonarius]